MSDRLPDLDVPFVREMARDVVEASRVRPGESVGQYGPNETGGTVIRPGGRTCYPAFWIRDFTMSLGSGLIGPQELRHALLLTAALQAPEDWVTGSGSLVPRGAIADHITFGGKPIFFPGTMDDYEHQGGEWGRYPSLDDHYFFVEMAWYLACCHGLSGVLGEEVRGMRLIDRLDLAFEVPPAREDTQLVWCGASNRGVSFGFTDSIIHTGELLFCSLLRQRAARQMSELHGMMGSRAAASRYERISRTIWEHVPRVFGHPSGLLSASTGKSAQADVWGSAFAVYTGALGDAEAKGVCRALSEALSRGTLSWKGQVRHVPTDGDFDGHTAWECTTGDYPKNGYQNGAYWATPTGWVCYAVAQEDEAAARGLAGALIEELKAGDFRRGAQYGAPFECVHPEGGLEQNAVYLTSVTCPLEVFDRLGWGGADGAAER